MAESGGLLNRYTSFLGRIEGSNPSLSVFAHHQAGRILVIWRSARAVERDGLENR